MKLVKASAEQLPKLEEFVNELGVGAAATLIDADFASGKVDLSGYLAHICKMAEGQALQPGWVAATTFWLLDDAGWVVGTSNLRHALTPALTKRGGHIGYYVKSSERGKGYGTLILTLTLDFAREMEISKVLLSVASDNTPSIRVVEANGGVLEDELYDVDQREPYRRYWIDLSSNPDAH